jgi:RNA polymerase sigma-70 factor (ECF subfamily)
MALLMLQDRGRAEEVTQDVFLKVWRALPGYDGRASPSTWLYTIARNTCLSALRSARHRRTTPLDETPEPGVSSEVLGHLSIAQCVAALPDVERRVITLFYWEDRSIQDVARALDLPEGTVKSHLHRARRRLGEMME